MDRPHMRAHDEFTANSLYLSDAGVEEKDFDHLTALAAKMCGCTMASISILGSEREYFKSTHGIALIDQPLRDSVFAILNQDSQEFVEVEDIYKDARLSPIAGMGYTSYAAVPVKDASGQTIAALSVMEKKALRLDSAQLANLSVLGCQVGRLFELKAVQSAEIRNRTAATNNSDRLQAIIDSAQLGTWEWHVQTGEVNVNARWAEIAGYTLADLAPIDINTWYRLIHPSDVAKSDAALQACLEGKSAYYDIECRLVHKLGNPIWINDRGRVVNRSSDGKALIMMGTHTDITKRKQTEIQFKAIADNIEGVVFRYQLFPDGSDSLQLVSQGALQIWGYTPEVVMNDIQLIWDRIDSRDLVGLRKSIVLSAEELKRWTYEFRYEHPNGSLIWLKGRGTPIHLEDGSVIWDSVMLDITEEKEAKIKAKEGERLVNESQKLAKLGSWMLDPETEKLIWSEGLYAVFGVDPDTFTASKRALHALIDQADLALLVDANRKILKTGDPFKIQYNITTPKGERRIVEEHSYCEKDISGKVCRLFGTAQDITERIQAQENINLMLSHTEEAFILVDLDLKIKSFNAEFARAYGHLFDKNPEIGISVLELVQEGREETVRNIYQKVFDGNRMEESVIRQASPGLGMRVYHNVFKPLKDTKGNCIGAFVTSIDVTEREHALEELIKSNERYRYVTKATSDAIWDYDIIDGSLYWGEGFQKLFGLNTDEPQRNYLNWQQHLHPDDSARAQEFVADRIAQGDTSWTQDYRFRKSNKHYANIRDKSHLIMNAEGKPVRIIGAMQDVTAQKEEERHLKLMESVITNTKDAVFIINPVTAAQHQFSISFVNDAACLMLGSSSAALLGKDFNVLFDQSKQQLEQDQLSDAMKSGNSYHSHLMQQKHDGAELWVDLTASPIKDQSDTILQWVIIQRDVTEQMMKILQKKLLSEISSFFNTEDDLKASLDKTLPHLRAFGDFSFTEVWMVNIFGDRLLLMAKCGDEGEAGQSREQLSTVNKLKRGEGLPGKVWASGCTEIWDGFPKEPLSAEHKAAKAAGIEASMGMPLTVNGEVLGVLVLGASANSKNLPYFRDLFNQLDAYLGAEISRKYTEQELHNFFNYAPDILAIASPDGYFRKVNPAFVKLMGYSEHELTSQPFSLFLHPDDKPSTTKEFQATTSGKKQAVNFENRYVTKSGEIKWISWSSSNLYREEQLSCAYGRDITEQKQFKNLLDAATALSRIGGWEADLVNQRHYWSSMTKIIHEVAPDFSPDFESFLNFYKDDYRQQAREELEACRNGKGSFEFELPIITAKGNERWIKVIGDGEFLGGQCVKLFGSVQDIHELKITQIELHQTLDEKNTILESIGDGFFAVNEDWLISYWNKKAEFILGLNREEAVGQLLWDVYPEEVKGIFYSHYNQVMEQRKSATFEWLHDKLNIWVEFSIHPAGHGLSVYFRDVTARKQAEEGLRISNERFEKVTQATNDAIWDWDIQNNTLYWGDGFNTLFGLETDRKNLDLDTWVANLHPGDSPEFIANLKLILNDPEANSFLNEYRFQKADKTYAHVVDRGVVIRNAHGKPLRVVGAIRDTSNQKKHEEALSKLNLELERRAKALERSNAELEQFVYVASHDLQEPLRMVTSFLAQIEKKYKGRLDGKADQYIHFAVDGASRMRQIILELLQYSRVGSLADLLEEVDTNTIVSDFLVLRKRLIAEKTAEITWDQLPVLHHYKVPLTQVFHNLLDNALKYAHPDRNAKVHVEGTETDTSWEFAISDNGIGIEEEYFEKIFVIFQRLHPREEYSGVGMGLAIVKKITDNFNGKISLESTPGSGSTFYFSIPK